MSLSTQNIFESCEVLSPKDLDYEKGRKFFNGAVNRYPAYIFKPKTEGEIISIVNFARENNYQIGVKNGGHSAYGNSIVDQSILIDISHFKKINISNDYRTVNVGGGVLTGELDLELKDYLRAIPLGDCQNVGVAGLALGGGFGFLSRKFGLTCDLLEKIRIVNHAGKIIEVSNQKHPELFWAMKGGGQNNFGIVTNMCFKLEEVPRLITTINMYWPIGKLKDISNVMVELLNEFENDISFNIRINRDLGGQPTARLCGMFFRKNGDIQIVSRKLNSIPGAKVREIVETSYYEAQLKNTSTVASNISFHWENRMSSVTLSDSLADELIDQFLSCPTKLGRINIDVMGGKISKINIKSSSFAHRKELYVISAIGVYQKTAQSEAMLKWTNNTINIIDRIENCAVKRYQNYEGLNSPTKDYFGNYTNKIQSLKKIFDPINLFIGLVKE